MCCAVIFPGLPWIEIVELGRSERNSFVFILIRSLDLELLQLLHQPLQRLLALLQVGLLARAPSVLVSLLGGLELLLRVLDGVVLGLDLGAEVLHRLVVGLGHRPLKNWIISYLLLEKGNWIETL